MAIAGRDEIENLYQGAADGVFRMEAATAERCVAAVQTLIDSLRDQQQGLWYLRFEIGGTFDSAMDMYEGFGRKADEFQALLVEYITAAERLMLSFGVAGAVIDQVEAENASGVLRVEDGGR